MQYFWKKEKKKRENFKVGSMTTVKVIGLNQRLRNERGRTFMV